MRDDRSDPTACEALRPLLSLEETSGEAPSREEREALERHLAGCEACRGAREEHRAAWSLLPSASLPAPPDGDARFLSAVRSRVRRSRLVRLSFTAGAAAAAALAVAALFWWSAPREDQSIIENLTVLEDLQAGQTETGVEVAEVGRALLTLLEDDAESADVNEDSGEWLDPIEGPPPDRKG